MRHLKVKNVVFAVLFFLFAIGIYGIARHVIVDSPIIGFVIAFTGLITIVFIAKRIR